MTLWLAALARGAQMTLWLVHRGDQMTLWLAALARGDQMTLWLTC